MASLAVTPYPSLLPSSLSLSLSLSLYIYIYMTHTHISTITWIPIRDKNNWWKWLMLWCQAKSVKREDAVMKQLWNRFLIAFSFVHMGLCFNWTLHMDPIRDISWMINCTVADWLMFHDCIISEAIINYQQ